MTTYAMKTDAGPELANEEPEPITRPVPGWLVWAHVMIMAVAVWSGMLELVLSRPLIPIPSD